MNPVLRTIATLAVGVVALMVALGTAGSPWDLRMTPDGYSGLALVGLLVAWVGVSLLLPRKRRL